MSHPRVLIVEDHPLMADALRVHVHSLLKTMVCVHAHSLQQGLLCLQQPTGFALVLLDLNLPDSQGLNTLNAFCAARPQGPMLVLTASDEEAVLQACLANNVDYIHKATSSSKLQAQLLKVMSKLVQSKAHPAQQLQVQEPAEPQGVDKLSHKQRLVLSLLSNGLLTSDIAAQLHVSEATVKTHMADIYQRLGVKNRTQASTLYVLWTQQHGTSHD